MRWVCRLALCLVLLWEKRVLGQQEHPSDAATPAVLVQATDTPPAVSGETHEPAKSAAPLTDELKGLRKELELQKQTIQTLQQATESASASEVEAIETDPHVGME